MGLLLFACCARAASIDNCGTRPDSAQAPQATQAVTFGPYRQGIPGVDLTARDIEFLWDLSYGVVSQAVQSTLNNFNQSIVFLTGTNPTAVNASNLQAVYNLLRQQGADWTTNPNDQTSYRVGRASGEIGSPDRAHTDLYIYNPAAPGQDTLDDGRYPSALISDNEDLSTGHALGDVNHGNSIMLRGPLPGSSIDLAGTGWTSPNRFSQVRVLHEIQHSMPGPNDAPGTTISELWSAAAEAINGLRDTTRSGEIPYTWPLLSAEIRNPPLRGSTWNYAGRTSFMAYVAYNFLNADSSRTLAGAADDLLVRWAKLPVRTLSDLKPLLTDAQCATCAARAYFHEGAAQLPVRDRLNLIHHNWRAANFVNNPNAAERQLGYPAWAGFSPATHQSAWQDFDNNALDDIVALPSIITLTPQQLTRDLSLEGDRTFRGSSFPMSLAPLAANYWVIRSDAALQTANRDLVIRVVPTACYACRNISGTSRELALLASAIGYNLSDATGDESVLWQNPQAVSFVSAVQGVDTDAPAALELVVPNFGASNRSVALILSSGDGRSGVFAKDVDQDYAEDIPYRLELSLRTAPYQTTNPLLVAALGNFAESAPTWAPGNDEIAYSAYDLAPAQHLDKIYRKKLDGSPAVALGAQPFLQRTPSWSPRGDAIAYEGAAIGTLASNLWIADLTPAGGATLRQLTALPGCTGMPTFQPNGQGVAYTYIPDPNSANPVCYLRWVGWNGNGDGQLAVLGTSNNFLRRPRWSPDGKTIYVAMADRGDSLYAVSSSGGTLRKIVAFSTPAAAFDTHPGSGRLAIESAVPMTNLAPAVDIDRCPVNLNALTIPAHRVGLLDTTVVAGKLSFQAPPVGTRSKDPAFASNGTTIAYVSEAIATNNSDVLVRQISWNHAPVFTAGVDDQALTAAVPFQVVLQATDADGEAITFKADYLPPGSTLYNGNTFRWLNPTSGTFFAVFRALDSSGGVARRVVRVSVAADPGGDPFRDGDGGCGACLRAQQAVASGASAVAPTVNSYLNGVLPGAWFQQTSRVSRILQDGSGRSMINLLASLPGSVAIDQSRLLYVDHALDETAMATSSGIVVGHLQPIDAAAAESGGDWLTSLASAVADSGALAVSAGTALTVSWGGSGVSAGLALDCSHLGEGWGDGAGVDVQVLEAGAWQTIDHVNPRRSFDLIGARIVTGNVARLVFLADARIRAIHAFSTTSISSAAEVHALAPEASSRPEGITALIAADSLASQLVEGEQISISYPTPPSLAGFVRSYFLDLRAAYIPPTGAWEARLRPAGPMVPARFALFQNRPNPFVRGTTFRFDVPRRAHVTLEIFDAQGRRVSSLLDRELPPGTHSYDWDGRDTRGALLSPGVYLYRLETEGFQTQRRLVLLAR